MRLEDCTRVVLGWSIGTGSFRSYDDTMNPIRQDLHVRHALVRVMEDAIGPAIICCCSCRITNLRMIVLVAHGFTEE